MSITKGAMLISNANAVGTELVNQLGGTGYKPVEWADKINLLGISDNDKASALAGITSGTYTGDERGAIKYSICNAVGAMLNKKFSTDRGFKPVEWESAISKLTPLVEGTVSGDICTIVNGADDVPTKSIVVTIPPTLTGVSEVSETQTGRNLASGGVYEYNSRNMIIPPVYLKAGTYTVSFNRGVNVQYIYIRKGDTVSLVGDAYATKSNSTFFTFTADEDAYYYAQLYRTNISDTWEDYPVTKPQIEIGSTAHAYEPYQTPTQYTASLGRTIHGGQEDIVNGTGQETHAKYAITGHETGYYLAGTNNNGNRIDFPLAQAQTPLYTGGLSNIGENKACLNSSTWTVGSWCIYSSRMYIVVPNEYTTYETALQYLVDNNATFVFPLATPTDFTFTGQEVPTRLGYNAFWSDSGDTEVTYRKDPDIPDPPVQVIDMNNNENNDN